MMQTNDILNFFMEAGLLVFALGLAAGLIAACKGKGKSVDQLWDEYNSKK